jgi:hypothetical protein
MFNKIIFFLFFIVKTTSLFARELSPGEQVVVCPNSSEKMNTSLVAAFAENRMHLHPAILGNTLDESTQKIIDRLARLNLRRSENFKRYLENMPELKMLPDIELNNPQDWDDDVISSECKVSKAILIKKSSRQPRGERIVSEDLWKKMNATTQATILFELYLIEDEYWQSYKLTINEIRNLIAYVISEEWDQLNLISYLKIQSEMNFGPLDIYGAYVSNTFNKAQDSLYTFFTSDRQSISLNGKKYNLNYNSDITLDENGTVRSLSLEDKGAFTAIDERKILLNTGVVFFDNLSRVIKGTLAEDMIFTNPLNEKINCKQSGNISFYKEGTLQSCLADAKTLYQNKMLLRPNMINWCIEADYCQNELTDYFDTRTKSGKFTLNQSWNKKMVLEVLGVKTISEDEGDFELNVANNDFYTNTLKVFANGYIASAEVKKAYTLQLDAFDYLDIASSGLCSPFKRYKSIIKYDRNGNLAEAVLKHETKLDGKFPARVLVPAKSVVTLNRYGDVESYWSVCK